MKTLIERWFGVGDIPKEDDTLREQPLNDDIDIRLENEEAPKFKRVYTKKLINGITIKIIGKKRYFNSSVYYSGELSQSNGRWVSFDPQRVADKILDRDIAPTVQRLSDEIIAADEIFRKNLPLTFKDENGITWRREG